MIRKHKSFEEILLLKEAGFDTRDGVRRVPEVPDDRVPCVYFFAAAGANLIKIGTVIDSSKIETRMNYLRPGCPFPLQHLFTLAPASRREETRLHKLFAEYNTYGEWFRCEGRLKSFLQYAIFDPEDARRKMLLKLNT